MFQLNRQKVEHLKIFQVNSRKVDVGISTSVAIGTVLIDAVITFHLLADVIAVTVNHVVSGYFIILLLDVKTSNSR